MNRHGERIQLSRRRCLFLLGGVGISASLLGACRPSPPVSPTVPPSGAAPQPATAANAPGPVSSSAPVAAPAVAASKAASPRGTLIIGGDQVGDSFTPAGAFQGRGRTYVTDNVYD